MKTEYIFNTSVKAIRTDLGAIIHILMNLSTGNTQEAQKIYEKYQKRIKTSEYVRAWKKKKASV